jgi:hypothetical protein
LRGGQYGDGIIKGDWADGGSIRSVKMNLMKRSAYGKGACHRNGGRADRSYRDAEIMSQCDT